MEIKEDYFKQDFVMSIIDNMNLERQVYHSGAVVGNDVNKLTKTANIKNLSNVFKPAIIQLQNGSQKEFSSHEKVVKTNTLLTKFQLCSNLYSLSRPLCRHEE